MLVPVLRAGLGMLDAILQLIPNARVGFIGLKREETTLRAMFYHKSLPANLTGPDLGNVICPKGEIQGCISSNRQS